MTIPEVLIEVFHKAKNIVVLTGAGISAESGIPTFRDAQTGLWQRYSPQELATPQAFEKDPELVWKWYAWRRTLISNAKPNPGHQALAQMEPLFTNFTVITQNIDGLHQEAGSKKVIELHGNIYQARCTVENLLFNSWYDNDAFPPTCPSCGGLLRPNVVWFGENLPADALESAYSLSMQADIMLCVGTSAIVQPAASLPFVALRNHAFLIEVNPAPTPVTPYTEFHFHRPAGDVLPELYAAIKP
jgi:NAD-dependent deacetylase